MQCYIRSYTVVDTVMPNSGLYEVVWRSTGEVVWRGCAERLTERIGKWSVGDVITWRQ